MPECSDSREYRISPQSTEPEALSIDHTPLQIVQLLSHLIREAATTAPKFREEYPTNANYYHGNVSTNY